LDKLINIPDAQRTVACSEPHPYDDLPAAPRRALMWQPREPEPSTINEKTIADFTRVVEQTGILEREPPTNKARQ